MTDPTGPEHEPITNDPNNIMPDSVFEKLAEAMPGSQVAEFARQKLAERRDQRNDQE